MNTKKGFVFSIDALVSFLIAMSMIYTIIFLSSVTASRNTSMLQMHTVATDLVVALSETPAVVGKPGSILDSVAATTGKSNLDVLVPAQYGYNLYISKDGGASWEKIAHPVITSNRPKDATVGKVVVYGVSLLSDNSGIVIENPYSYKTCHGSDNIGGLPCSIPGFYKSPSGVQPVLIKLELFM